MRTSTLVLALLIVLAVPAGAIAALDRVLTAARQDELCGPEVGGRRVVDRHRLAMALVDEATVPAGLLDRANPKGLADGNVGRDEIVYAIRADEPFGARPMPDPDKKVVDATSRLRRVQQELGDVLIAGGVSDQGYVVVNRSSGPALPRDVFNEASGVQIECTRVAIAIGPTTEPSAGWGETLARTISGGLRVRGKLEDLALGGDRVDEVEAAEVSFTRDEREATETFQIKGIVGYAFRWKTDTSSFSAIPYVRYERTDNNPNSAKKSDVHVVSPGALLAYEYFGQRFFPQIGVSPEATLDIAQSSQVLKAKGFLLPAFRLGDDGTPFLGAYLPPVPVIPIVLRPVARVIAELAHVFEKGDNEALKDERPYVGIGFELELKARLWQVPIFSDFVATATYRFLQLFGTNIANAQRFEAALSYRLSDHFALKAGYTDGRNEETFQKERYWSLSLGLKY